MWLAFGISGDEHSPSHSDSHHFSKNGRLRALRHYLVSRTLALKSRADHASRARVFGEANPRTPSVGAARQHVGWRVDVEWLHHHRADDDAGSVFGGDGDDDIEFSVTKLSE